MLKKAVDPAAERPKLQKAVLTSYDQKNGKKGIELECQFNPETLTIARKVEWHGKKNKETDSEAQPRKNAPTLEFGGGNSATFDLDLVFDTTSLENQDVRGYTNQLMAMTLMGGGDSNKLEEDPPAVLFTWGEVIMFFAVITSVSISYTQFLPSGRPIRARARVGFAQLLDEDGKKKSQNPTTQTAARKTYRVQQGDRLDYLAYVEYGHPSLWREIANANGLNDPLDLQPGQILVLPKLS